MDDQLPSDIPENVLASAAICEQAEGFIGLPPIPAPPLDKMGLQKLVEHISGESIYFSNLRHGAVALRNPKMITEVRFC